MVVFSDKEFKIVIDSLDALIYDINNDYHEEQDVYKLKDVKQLKKRLNDGWFP